MKKQVHLQLAFHHHQPVGNLPWVLEDCYQNAYRPLMECLLDYPALKVHLSYSGPLLRFLEREHPEYLDWIRELVDQERVEFLATGFYEPVLVDIPVKDQIGQLEMSCRWIEERFGQRPKGVWLAEFVWKNFIASSFKELGLEYTLINSNRFLQAGIPKAEVNGHYFTEYLGDTVALFPVDRQMVDFIPFGEKQDALTYLRRQANRGDVSVTFADVAERWGVWPGTYQKIQQSGVAAEWFKTIAESDWIRCRFFQEELEWSPSHGRCYLPEGASIELGAWSLPDMARARYYEAKDQLGRRHDAEWFLPYFRAGSWEGFRARYGEAHLMAKKGEWLRKLMKPEEIDQVVVDSLWQAQCNTAYWHGTSGGIYLPHLREAIWKHLLSAHRRLNEDIEDLQLIEEDFDADGIDEIITHNDKTSCIIAPAQGGAIVELSLLQPLVNLSNTLTRRSEVTPEGGKRTEGPIDPYERHWFHEHFFERQTLVKNLKLNQKADKGDLVHQSARVISVSQNSKHIECVLEMNGKVDSGGTPLQVRVRKAYLWDLQGTQLKVSYQVTNESGLPLDGIFSSELNIMAGSSEGGGIGCINEKREFNLTEDQFSEHCRQLQIKSPELGFEIALLPKKEITLWSYPLETENASPGITYQGACINLGWDLDVAPGESADFELGLRIGRTVLKKIG